MYVANQLDSSWLLNVQRTLFARSKDKLDYVFCKLWGLITDPRNLRIALVRVALLALTKKRRNLNRPVECHHRPADRIRIPDQRQSPFRRAR